MIAALFGGVGGAPEGGEGTDLEDKVQATVGSSALAFPVLSAVREAVNRQLFLLQGRVLQLTQPLNGIRPDSDD